jgi:hypothetical protein
MDAADERITVDGLDREGLTWRRSSYCNSTTCVEVAHDRDRVLVRDSKIQNGPALEFSLPEWRAFLRGVFDGEFDLT